MNKTYGLIGNPLLHSFSKRYFDAKFENEQVKDISYQLFPLLALEEFKPLLQKRNDLWGLNVTIPYKEKIVKYVNKVNAIAYQIGAVNTIKIVRDNHQCITYGYNTDVIGFEYIFNKYNRFTHSSALILGTGGVAKAVAYVLKQKGISYRFVSRQNNENTLTYNQLNEEIIKQSSLLINCTPIGMFPEIDNFPAIPYQAITCNHIVIDLIYNPSETLFLQKAKIRGAVVENGYEMFCCQAEASWKIWNEK